MPEEVELRDPKEVDRVYRDVGGKSYYIQGQVGQKIEGGLARGFELRIEYGAFNQFTDQRTRMGETSLFVNGPGKKPIDNKVLPFLRGLEKKVSKPMKPLPGTEERGPKSKSHYRREKELKRARQSARRRQSSIW